MHDADGDGSSAASDGVFRKSEVIVRLVAPGERSVEGRVASDYSARGTTREGGAEDKLHEDVGERPEHESGFIGGPKRRSNGGDNEITEVYSCV